MTPEKAFAQVLREIRTQRGLSQENLGFESGFHRTYIGLLERGLRCPSIKVVLRLAVVLNVPASKIMAQVEKRLAMAGESR